MCVYCCLGWGKQYVWKKGHTIEQKILQTNDQHTRTSYTQPAMYLYRPAFSDLHFCRCFFFVTIFGRFRIVLDDIVYMSFVGWPKTKVNISPLSRHFCRFAVFFLKISNEIRFFFSRSFAKNLPRNQISNDEWKTFLPTQYKIENNLWSLVGISNVLLCVFRARQNIYAGVSRILHFKYIVSYHISSHFVHMYHIKSGVCQAQQIRFSKMWCGSQHNLAVPYHHRCVHKMQTHTHTC